MTCPQILIVDDNTFNVYSLRLLVEETFKLPCDSAFSAKEALQMIKERIMLGMGVHKLILTDINMPEIDGLQMSKMIKNNLKKMRAGKECSFTNSNFDFDSTSPHLSLPNQQPRKNLSIESMLNQNLETKIYAVTAMNEEHIGDTYGNYGIEEVMSKPVNTELLKPIFNKLFPNRVPVIKHRKFGITNSLRGAGSISFRDFDGSSIRNV